ncbi:unnamed protein product [Lactuca saligna]|uniref:Uncharacterized protein n=1 Tax=Lactuca saligna TaxID=75948 RepID=A0AA35V3U6_LACSI|nr:unnamed protein product [Lactuca saligna]
MELEEGVKRRTAVTVVPIASGSNTNDDIPDCNDASTVVLGFDDNAGDWNVTSNGGNSNDYRQQSNSGAVVFASRRTEFLLENQNLEAPNLILLEDSKSEGTRKSISKIKRHKEISFENHKEKEINFRFLKIFTVLLQENQRLFFQELNQEQRSYLQICILKFYL